MDLAQNWTPPGPASYPSTFQDVLTPDFLKSLYSNINNQQEQDVGNAEGGAIARGLTGTPFEAAGIGAANQTADTARNSALQGFLYNLAGMKQQENVIGEGQQFGLQEQNIQNTWEAQQNDLQRQLGYAQLSEQEKLQNMKDTYGLYTGALGAAGTGAGALLGGL